MDKELIYKKIDNCIEQRKILWTVVVVLATGTAGIILTFSGLSLEIRAIIKSILVVLGILGDYFFLNKIVLINQEISRLFTIIEKGEVK